MCSPKEYPHVWQRSLKPGTMLSMGVFVYLMLKFDSNMEIMG